ncbi:MAG: hypothetical protein ABIG90_01615 [bacterium]
MFLTIHAAVGGLIGEKITNNQWLALVFGFLSHFILDMIPHNDSVIIDQKNKPVLFLRVVLDLIFLFIFMQIWIYCFNLKNNRVFLAGAIGALLPDAIWGIHEQWKIKGLGWFYKMHNYFHQLFFYQVSRKKALLGQIAIIILVSYLLK